MTYLQGQCPTCKRVCDATEGCNACAGAAEYAVDTCDRCGEACDRADLTAGWADLSGLQVAVLCPLCADGLSRCEGCNDRFEGECGCGVVLCDCGFQVAAGAYETHRAKECPEGRL